jgi:hypothetical protein
VQKFLCFVIIKLKHLKKTKSSYHWDTKGRKKKKENERGGRGRKRGSEKGKNGRGRKGVRERENFFKKIKKWVREKNRSNADLKES